MYPQSEGHRTEADPSPDVVRESAYVHMCICRSCVCMPVGDPRTMHAGAASRRGQRGHSSECLGGTAESRASRRERSLAPNSSMDSGCESTQQSRSERPRKPHMRVRHVGSRTLTDVEPRRPRGSMEHCALKWRARMGGTSGSAGYSRDRIRDVHIKMRKFPQSLSKHSHYPKRSGTTEQLHSRLWHTLQRVGQLRVKGA